MFFFLLGMTVKACRDLATLPAAGDPTTVSENGSATLGWVPVVAGHVTYEDVLCDLGIAPDLCSNFIFARTVHYVTAFSV